MKHIPRVVGALLILGTLLVSGCAKKDKQSAEVMVTDYWQAVFSGKAKRAYSMLARESRRRISLGEYAERVAFGRNHSPVKDSFWEAYTTLCDVSVGTVKITADTAWVDVLLTLPDLPMLVEKLTPKADSLFEPSDSLARKHWLLRKLASALKDHRYMTLLMHLSLKLQYECGGWRLVYEYKPEEK